MDGVLSQEEINALLNDDSGSDSSDKNDRLLTDEEKDAIGEIANISMGTAATTLFSLVNRRVEISTPVVSFSNWDDIVASYEKPCVFIKIAYTVGLDGSNILVLKERDVKVITDLMMGGDGTNTDEELGELHLSAISEAMNQMMGSAATSLSSMLNKTIDISPPVADIVDLKETVDEGQIDEFLTGEFVKISFKMEIGDLVDSEIMQLYPIPFAKEMCQGVTKNMELDSESITEDSKPISGNNAAASQTNTSSAQQPNMGAMNMGQSGQQPMMGQPMMGQPQVMGQQVNVQPAQFSAFGAMPNGMYQPENIGRTHKKISEILDFGLGKIIELNKIAGEPIDVLVNGKYVAKGEVVVIEESFGVRIPEIVNVPKPKQD